MLEFCQVSRHVEVTFCRQFYNSYEEEEEEEEEEAGLVSGKKIHRLPKIIWNELLYSHLL
jgi:hypothetical protein